MDTFTPISEEIPSIPKQTSSPTRVRSRWRVVAWIGGMGATGLVILIISMVVNHALRESRRERCAIQLKRIGLAMHEYQAAHDHFPAPAIVGQYGMPLLSWRVALLPYLGYQSLYERFHLDEPWDSPHNRALIPQMPAELECPGGMGRRTGRTSYLVVVGPTIDATSVNTPFDSTRGVDIREITDGTSNTILVFEADTLVPWTKPEDLRWDRNQPLPRLVSPHSGGANVLFADGTTTRFLKSTISPVAFLALFTANGGEVISA